MATQNKLAELQRDIRRLCEMVGAAYTAGWLAGYATIPLGDESEENKDFHCGEDWVDDALRSELLGIMERSLN
jgi:hypothetical protein